MISVRTAAGLEVVTAPRVRTAGGVKGVASARIRAGGGLQEFFAPSSGSFSVNATPLSVSGARASPGSVTVPTEEVTALVVGGQAPYTYAWALDEALGGTWSIESPSSATTRFVCEAVADGGFFDATFICTVTDARGFSSDSAPVGASAVNYGVLF